MDGGDGIGKDLCDMQTLATRKDGIGGAGPADRYLPAAAPLAVSAATSDLCEVRDGGGQSDSSPRIVAKPVVSPRRGLSNQRIWVCRSVIDEPGPFLSRLRLGYGYTVAEAYAEWEAS